VLDVRWRSYRKNQLGRRWLYDDCRNIFSKIAHSPGVLAKYDFIRNECGLRFETDTFLWEPLIRANTSSFLFYENIALLSERHVSISMDERGLLHHERAPALLYPDGWGICAWHGTPVPEYVITSPEAITLADIERSSGSQKAVMSERYGLTRYFKERGARVVQEDSCGTLFRAPGGAMLVRVVNATPEPDGRYREFFLSVPRDVITAKQAVSWTFGLSDLAYMPEVQT
jgi:hypothetical protein